MTMQYSNKNKIGFFILFILIAILFLFFFLQIPQSLYKEYTLKNTYTKIVDLIGKNDCAGLYDYVLPTEKFSTSLEKFTAEECENNVYSIEAIINSINIKDDEGYINRTVRECHSETCTGDSLYETTGVKKYFFINGKWYFSLTEGNIFCTRTQPYSMLPEFQRALSLIRQRFENIQRADAASGLKKIYNCLDIQYASSEAELNGAEGIFKFDNNTSTTDDLKILVSPKYQAKDDLLTAILLSHEISHASFHAIGADKNMSCFENEAYAFNAEIVFLRSALNDEEKKSIESRYYSSQEARGLIDLNKAILNYGGNNVYDATLQYVKQSSFYQAQCAGEN